MDKDERTKVHHALAALEAAKRDWQDKDEAIEETYRILLSLLVITPDK